MRDVLFPVLDRVGLLFDMQETHEYNCNCTVCCLICKKRMCYLHSSPTNSVYDVCIALVLCFFPFLIYELIVQIRTSSIYFDRITWKFGVIKVAQSDV